MKKALLLNLALFLSSLTAMGQISISESFSSSSLPSFWSSNLNYSTSSNYNCNNSGARYKNLYGSYNNGYVKTGNLGAPISGSTINVSYDFSVREYSSYSATPAGEFTITASYSTDGSTWNVISGSTIDGNNYSATTSCTTGSFSFSSPVANALYLRIDCDHNTGDFYFSINEWSITETSPCSGTPAPGNTIAEVSSSAVSSVCNGATVDFSLQNAGSIGTGASYQWESSSDGTTYASISGETSATYSGTVSAATYYRCAVTCSGNTGYSTAKQITMNSAPTAQPSSLTFSAASSSITPSWVAANDADGYIVIRHTSALSGAPVDGSDYSAGDALGGGTVGYVGTSTSGSVSSLTSNTNYSFTVYSYKASDDGCKKFYTTSPLTGSQYTTPSTVSSPSFSNETTSGFNLSWNAPANGASSYLYTVYSDYYSTPVSASYENVSTSNTSISVSGLSASSTYYVRIWAVGTGGTGSSYNGGSVQTNCDVTTAPATQDFGTGSSFIQCWERYTGSVTSNSTLSSTSSGWGMEASATYRPDNFTGSFVEIYAYASNGSFWLVSESFDLGNTAGQYRLNYDIALSSSSYYSYSTTLSDHQVDVLISDDDGATWSNANIIKTYTSSSSISNDGQSESIDLTTYSGTIKVAFVLTEGAYSSRYVGIDDVEIEAIPACSGIPDNGITASSETGAAGTNTTLSVTGVTGTTGVTYQWQSSTDNITFTDIANATSATCDTAIGSSSAYYRRKITCTNSSQYALSWPVEVAPASAGGSSVNLGTSGSQTNACGTNITLYDNGGSAGSYSNNCSGYIILQNGGSSIITISGTSTTENNYDYLKIYDGSSASGSALASYTGTSQSVSYTSSPGQTLSVQLTSDGSATKSGINLTISYSGDCNAITYSSGAWSQTPSSSDHVTFLDDYTVSGHESYGNVTLSGADLTIPKNTSLTVSGNLWLDATSSLTSESHASGYSQLLVTGHVRNDGTITQQSTLKGNGSAGMTSSMKEGFETTTGLTTSALYQYDAASGSYVNATDLTAPAVGYFGLVGANGVMSSTGTFGVSGTPITNFTHSLGYTSNQQSGGSGNGWNLLGNPYTCQLDWSLATKTNVNNAIYVWDRTGKKYKYHVNGVSTPNGAIFSGAMGSSLIPPMHAFWVQATGAGASVTSTMGDDGAVSTSPGHFNKSNADNVIVSVRALNDSTIYDATWIIDNPSSSLGFNGYSDAWKLFNTAGPNLFTSISDEDMSINALDLSQEVEIPLGLEDLNETMAYVMKVDQIVNQADYHVELRDNHYQTTSAFPPQGYVFIKEQYIGLGSRFTLVIKPTNNNSHSDNSVGVEEHTQENLVIYTDASHINIIGDVEGYHSYRLLTVNGQVIAEGALDQSIAKPQLESMVIIQLLGERGTYSKKLIITHN